VKIVSAEQIEAAGVAAWPLLVDAAERALVALADGSTIVPPRPSLPLSEGTLLLMPGRIQGATSAAVKLVSVVAENASRALPAVQGVVVLFDAYTGTPLAVLDGAAETGARTAAVSLAAVRRFGRAHRRVAILGAGVQALWHARACAALCTPEEITIWSRTPEHCQDLAARLTPELRTRVTIAGSASAAVTNADLVFCCTSSSTPVLNAPMLRDGEVVVVAVGAYRPEMVEVDASVFARAATVYVDDPVGVAHEAGDVLAALAAGVISPERVRAIGGEVDAGQVALFKSVGNAAEDAAVAEAILAAVG
jgi:ornithine cyclodeaminase/alanine dehydrogenase-like protein (mu-crystallin family)